MNKPTTKMNSMDELNLKQLTRAQLLREIDLVRTKLSRLCFELIAAGRGYEPLSVLRKYKDDLAVHYVAISTLDSALATEKARRLQNHGNLHRKG
jgi:hypothetical protein